MIQAADTKWIDFVRHILKWEGKQSKDPRDQAAKCVQPGQVHTNRGVTYCTFQALAGSLGVTPVTYERFLAMTDADAGKFIYRFYTDIKGSELPDPIALAMTEAAWGSGPNRAYTHLREALQDLGKVTSSNVEARKAAKLVNTDMLFDKYQARRRQFLESTLGSQAKYSMFVKGWINRLEDFTKKFNPPVITWGIPLFFLLLVLRNKLK